MNSTLSGNSKIFQMEILEIRIKKQTLKDYIFSYILYGDKTRTSSKVSLFDLSLCGIQFHCFIMSTPIHCIFRPWDILSSSTYKTEPPGGFGLGPVT